MKLDSTVSAVITGGDSGIGRAVAVAYAHEGADSLIAYFDEHDDARETVRLVEEAGRRCIAVAGDIGEPDTAAQLVARALEAFGRIDIVVNNAAEQHLEASIEDIDAKQVEKTFRTNVFAMFHLSRAALPHLKRGACIVESEHGIIDASLETQLEAIGAALSATWRESGVAGEAGVGDRGIGGGHGVRHG